MSASNGSSEIKLRQGISQSCTTRKLTLAIIQARWPQMHIHYLLSWNIYQYLAVRPDTHTVTNYQEGWTCYWSKLIKYVRKSLQNHISRDPLSIHRQYFYIRAIYRVWDTWDICFCNAFTCKNVFYMGIKLWRVVRLSWCMDFMRPKAKDFLCQNHLMRYIVFCCIQLLI